MIRNLYNQISYPALKIKRKITKYINWQQFTKGTRGKPNEQLFPRQVVIQLCKYVTHIIGEPKYKYGQQEQVTVRNYNSSTSELKEGMAGGGGGGCLNRFTGTQPRPQLLLWLKTYLVVRSAWRFSNSSMAHHGRQLNHG